MFFPSSPGANMTCGFKVNTSSPGWYKSMTKVLKSINGASYAIDVEEGMAYVTGRVDPGSLLKKLKKSNKHAELAWVSTGSNIMPGNKHYDYYDRYMQDVGIVDPYWDVRRAPMAAPRYPPPPVPYIPNYGYHQPFVYDPNAYWHRNMY